VQEVRLAALSEISSDEHNAILAYEASLTVARNVKTWNDNLAVIRTRIAELIRTKNIGIAEENQKQLVVYNNKLVT